MFKVEVYGPLEALREVAKTTILKEPTKPQNRRCSLPAPLPQPQ